MTRQLTKLPFHDLNPVHPPSTTPHVMDVFDPNPINVNLAQSTPVIKISSLLSIEEVTAITAWGETEFDQSKESSGWELRHWDGSWKVAFLSKNNDFNTRFPNTIAKIKEHVQKIDHEYWNDAIHQDMPKDDKTLQVRVIEYHRQVGPGPGLPDVNHYDLNSCATIDIMLSAPGEFSGGTFNTLEESDSLMEHTFSIPGDAIVFVSHKYHSVKKVTHGIRRVLVIELWRGPERTCNHRCESLSMVCAGGSGAP